MRPLLITFLLAATVFGAPGIGTGAASGNRQRRDLRSSVCDVFVNGRKYFTFRNEGTGSRARPFDEPQCLLVNLAIGGSWCGQKGIDDSRFPHRYLVDYVRIYQHR